MVDNNLVMSRIKGFSLGVLVVVCWLLFATIYSAFKHKAMGKDEVYVLEGEVYIEQITAEEYEELFKANLLDLQELESYGEVKTIDDRDELIKDARSAAQVTQDLCIELNMEKCL